MSTVVGGWVLQGNTIGTWGLSVWGIPTFLVLLMLVPPGGPVRAVLQMKVVASPPTLPGSIGVMNVLSRQHQRVIHDALAVPELWAALPCC